MAGCWRNQRSDILLMPKPTLHEILIDRQRENDIQHKEPDADKRFGRVPSVNPARKAVQLANFSNRLSIRVLDEHAM